MKQFWITLALFALVINVNAQSKSVAALKEKYQAQDDFFNLELGGNFMDFAEGFRIDIDEDDLATVAKSIENLKFFTLPEGSDSEMELKSLSKGLEKEKYELLVEVAEKGSAVSVYSKGASMISDLVILIGGEDDSELMVVELKGKFMQETLAKATSKFN